jgi:hypothetical protein
MLHTAVLPAAGLAAQKSLAGVVPGLKNVPLAVLAPFIGNIGSFVRGLIPN